MSFGVPSFLTGSLWKFATGGAALVALILGVFLATSQLQNRDLLKQRDSLQAKINDPISGYIAQLSQARTNVSTLTETVVRQNVAYEKLSAESKAKLEATRVELAAAQVKTKSMEKRLNGFLATGPKGATLEERIRDIDERATRELLQ